MFRYLLLLVSVFQAASATIRTCEAELSVFKITELNLTPDPPVKGDDITLSVKFNNPGFSVVSGTSKTSASLNFVPLPDTLQPLCDSTTCPIEMGANERHTTAKWPDSVSGLVKSKLEWIHDTNELLLCIELTTKVGDSFLKQSYNEFNETNIEFLTTLLNLKTPSSWEPSTIDTTAYSLLSDTFN